MSKSVDKSNTKIEVKSMDIIIHCECGYVFMGKGFGGNFQATTCQNCGNFIEVYVGDMDALPEYMYDVTKP